MKTKQVNKIMYAAGILLLAALITYLSNWSRLLLDSLLIAASIIAGIPTFLKAWRAFLQKMFSIELLVTIAVIGALIIGGCMESAADTFMFLFGAFLGWRSVEKAAFSPTP